jgi:predicted nucleic acid-binding protein
MLAVAVALRDILEQVEQGLERGLQDHLVLAVAGVVVQVVMEDLLGRHTDAALGAVVLGCLVKAPAGLVVHFLELR